MSLLQSIDAARARALLRYQDEQSGQQRPQPVPVEKPRPAPAIARLLRLPLYLFFGGLPLFGLLGLAGLDIETPFYLFGKSMLLLSSAGFALTVLAAFGRLPSSWARDWQPSRVTLLPRAVLLGLLWLSLLIEMPWLSLLTPVIIARPIMRFTNAASLRAMEERELLRLRRGLPPTPPIA